MTIAAVLSKQASAADLGDRWASRAVDAVRGAVDRAHAHGVVALTEVLKRTPDGRPTLRHAFRSRSYNAAIKDMADLATLLAGPSTSSLAGMLRDAREAMYRRSFAGWLAVVPEEFGIPPDSGPTKSRIADARGLVLHGMELRREVQAPADVAVRSLLAVLEQSGRKGIDPGTDLLDGWKVRSFGAISQAVRTAVADAMKALDHMAALDVTRPEFRPTDEYTPG